MIIVISENMMQARHFAETTGLVYPRQVLFVNSRQRLRGYSSETTVVVFGAIRSSEIQKTYEEALERFEVVMRVTDIG